MYPARTRNLCEATSASDGASRNVGINSSDQRCIVFLSTESRVASAEIQAQAPFRGEFAILLEYSEAVRILPGRCAEVASSRSCETWSFGVDLAEINYTSRPSCILRKYWLRYYNRTYGQ